MATHSPSGSCIFRSQVSSVLCFLHVPRTKSYRARRRRQRILCVDGPPLRSVPPVQVSSPVYKAPHGSGPSVLLGAGLVGCILGVREWACIFPDHSRDSFMSCCGEFRGHRIVSRSSPRVAFFPPSRLVARYAVVEFVSHPLAISTSDLKPQMLRRMLLNLPLKGILHRISVSGDSRIHTRARRACKVS